MKEDDSIQAIASPAETQCDQLHAVPRDEAYPTVRWDEVYEKHFPQHTDPTSRHIKVIAEGLRDLESTMRIDLAEYDPDHMAASMESTVLMLWRARARIAELETALADIARQKLPIEMRGDILEDEADWEGGYEACVRIARSALASPQREGDRPVAPNDGQNA